MEKPVVKFSGANGNVFNLLSIATVALRKADQLDKAHLMQAEVMGSGSYDEALQIMMKYVEVK